MNSELLLFIIKLAAGGIVSFLAILLMSKTREPGWIFMVGGFLLSYAALVFQLMEHLGIFTSSRFTLFGIPISSLICVILPAVFFIVAFIMMLCKK